MWILWIKPQCLEAIMQLSCSPEDNDWFSAISWCSKAFWSGLLKEHGSIWYSRKKEKNPPCWLALTEKHWHSSRWLKARLWVGVKIIEVCFCFLSKIILYDFVTNKNKYLECLCPGCAHIKMTSKLEGLSGQRLLDLFHSPDPASRGICSSSISQYCSSPCANHYSRRLYVQCFST